MIKYLCLVLFTVSLIGCSSIGPNSSNRGLPDEISKSDVKKLYLNQFSSFHGKRVLLCGYPFYSYENEQFANSILEVSIESLKNTYRAQENAGKDGISIKELSDDNTIKSFASKNKGALCYLSDLSIIVNDGGIGYKKLKVKS